MNVQKENGYFPYLDGIPMMCVEFTV